MRTFKGIPYIIVKAEGPQKIPTKKNKHATTITEFVKVVWVEVIVLYCIRRIFEIQLQSRKEIYDIKSSDGIIKVLHSKKEIL